MAAYPGAAIGIVEASGPHVPPPGSDGTELVESIGGIADVPVIFPSAYGREEVIARALEAGAADYFVLLPGGGSRILLRHAVPMGHRIPSPLLRAYGLVVPTALAEI